MPTLDSAASARMQSTLVNPCCPEFLGTRCDVVTAISFINIPTLAQMSSLIECHTGTSGPAWNVSAGWTQAHGPAQRHFLVNSNLHVTFTFLYRSDAPQAVTSGRDLEVASKPGLPRATSGAENKILKHTVLQKNRQDSILCFLLGRAFPEQQQRGKGGQRHQKR